VQCAIGETARIWTMAQQGVPARVGLVAVGIERAAARLSIAIVVAAFAITVAPRLVDLGTPFFAVATTIIALCAIGWTVILRRKR